ncbi:MAG TPA: peroxiredoxin [Chloroflexia bacterium]|nr:peroxiredoxin [Chloroflexia bacterium]
MWNNDTHDVQIGQPAPDFTLENENGEKVQLSELRGRPVVLMFYPFDWSGLCTKEICTLRDNFPNWSDTGAQVFGISRDSKYSHKAWKDHLGLEYSLLADLVGEVAKQYGAWNDDLHRANRTTIVIDPEGTIRYIVHNDSGTARNQDEILEAVRGMAAARR